MIAAYLHVGKSFLMLVVFCPMFFFKGLILLLRRGESSENDASESILAKYVNKRIFIFWDLAGFGLESMIFLLVVQSK